MTEFTYKEIEYFSIPNENGDCEGCAFGPCLSNKCVDTFREGIYCSSEFTDDGIDCIFVKKEDLK
jgi:hypothetical protein